jgi:hypothetical protein
LEADHCWEDVINRDNPVVFVYADRTNFCAKLAAALESILTSNYWPIHTLLHTKADSMCHIRLKGRYASSAELRA